MSRKPQPVTLVRKPKRKQPEGIPKLDPDAIRRAALREIFRVIADDRHRGRFILPESLFEDEFIIPKERQFASLVMHGGQLGPISAALGLSVDATLAALVRLAAGAIVEPGGHEHGREAQVS